jgi:hypothetical protein
LDPDEYSRYRPEDNWTVGGIVEALRDHQTRWMLGALYGLRGYDQEEWSQLTITSSIRHQLANTTTYQDQIWWYVFFNRATGSVVLGSNDVFEDEEEMRDVCTRLGCDITELQRTTGGAGITWARTNITTGESLSLHFFFEGGVQSERDYDSPEMVEGAPVVDWQDQAIFRGGLSLSLRRDQPSSTLGTRYTVGITGSRGPWTLLPGSIGDPQRLPTWRGDITSQDMGWMGMFYLGIDLY